MSQMPKLVSQTPETTTIPSGMMMTASLAELNDGRMIAQIDQAIADCTEALHQYKEKSKDSRGKATITVQIEIMEDPDYEGHAAITAKIRKAVPATKTKALCTLAGGRLLVDASKRNLGGRQIRGVEQIDLFTVRGELVGVADPTAGTMQKAVEAGKA